MIQAIADHIRDKAPAYIVAGFIAGMSFFVSAVWQYKDFRDWQEDVDTRLDWRVEQVAWNDKMEERLESTDSRVTFLLLEGGHITPADLIKDVDEDDEEN